MILFAGCSGYYYSEWKNSFYPAGLAAKSWLGFYAQHFNSVEINSTFYKMPALRTLHAWYGDTPEDFSFTLKAPKLFSHIRQMSGIDEDQIRFYENCSEGLKKKLGCVLYQFPGSLRYDPKILEAVRNLSRFPVLNAVEFRHPSWWRQEVYTTLEEAGVVFVNVSFPGLDDVFVPGQETAYLRFHGKPVLYKSGYGTEGLRPWVDALEKTPPRRLFAYFNNTWFGEALSDARLLRDLISQQLRRSGGY